MKGGRTNVPVGAAADVMRRKHSPGSPVMLNVRCVTGFGQGGVRGQARAGTGGCHGFPVNRLRRTSSGRCPCLRAVSM